MCTFRINNTSINLNDEMRGWYRVENTDISKGLTSVTTTFSNLGCIISLYEKIKPDYLRSMLDYASKLHNVNITKFILMRLSD